MCSALIFCFSFSISFETPTWKLHSWFLLLLFTAVAHWTICYFLWQLSYISSIIFYAIPKKKKSSFTCKVLKNLSFQGEHLGVSSCLVILANHFIFFHFLTRKSKSVSDKRVIELLEDSGKICCILLPCCQEWLKP